MKTRKAISYPMSVATARGVESELSHAEYVNGLIRQVLLTRPGERVHRPSFGAGVADMVFAPASRAMADLARAMVWRALNEYLTEYIELEQVKVESTMDTLIISVQYILRSNGTRQFLNEEVSA